MNLHSLTTLICHVLYFQIIEAHWILEFWYSDCDVQVYNDKRKTNNFPMTIKKLHGQSLWYKYSYYISHECRTHFANFEGFYSWLKTFCYQVFSESCRTCSYVIQRGLRAEHKGKNVSANWVTPAICHFLKTSLQNAYDPQRCTNIYHYPRGTWIWIWVKYALLITHDSSVGNGHKYQHLKNEDSHFCLVINNRDSE